jgi:Xaa-Pro aminopeptidase
VVYRCGENACLIGCAEISLRISAWTDFLPHCQQAAAGKKVMLDADYAPVALRFAIEHNGGEVVWHADPIAYQSAQKPC